MSFLLHADDFGLTRRITDNILGCIDNGVLNSTSIFANGYAFEYALEEYERRKNVRLSLHLNLVEGRPVMPPQEIDLLVNREGYLFRSFQSLYLKYKLSNDKLRRRLRKQVQSELGAQIQKFIDHAGKDRPLHVDSHLHYHMIPFVFDSLLGLKEKYDIRYVRVPQEPFFIHLESLSDLRNYFTSNLVKHRILNHLGKKYRYCERLKNFGIQYCDYFIGVLFTGRMSAKVVSAALAKIDQQGGDCQNIEILFHPGQAALGEESYWKRYGALRKYYFSKDRQRENENLQNGYFKGLIDLRSRIGRKSE